MTKNLDLNGLQSIADNYDLFYIDLWGVVHNGVSLHEKAIVVLNELLKKKKMLVLLTNAPRPNKTVQNFLEKMGMDKELRDHVFTSGEAALNYLKKSYLYKKFYHIGPPRDFDLFYLFEKINLEIVAGSLTIFYGEKPNAVGETKKSLTERDFFDTNKMKAQIQIILSEFFIFICNFKFLFTWFYIFGHRICLPLYVYW